MMVSHTRRDLPKDTIISLVVFCLHAAASACALALFIGALILTNLYN